MDSELQQKLARRMETIDQDGEKFESSGIGVGGKADASFEYVTFKDQTHQWESIAEIQNSMAPKAELTVGADNCSAKWYPKLQMPLPHVFTSEKFRLCESDGWQMKFYPRGTKGEGDKITLTISGPSDASCRQVALICGKQMQMPVDWTGENSFDFLPRQLETKLLELCVLARKK